MLEKNKSLLSLLLYVAVKSRPDVAYAVNQVSEIANIQQQ